MVSLIDKGITSLERISEVLRETPLVALRQMLPDEDILLACREVGHRFRRRLYDPVVTVFHFLLQAVQREESFAATWQELWINVTSELGVEGYDVNSSALSQARSRLPHAVFQRLLTRVCAVQEERFSTWRGFRLLALDGSTVSMPRENALLEHYGTHRTKDATTRYPLATFCSLLSVGTSLILDYRFGPYDPGELKTAAPLLQHLNDTDLLLADRRCAGSALLAGLRKRNTHFLVRKHHRLRVGYLPVIKRLGRNDFITAIPIPKEKRKLDRSLPETLRVRIFKARWTSPAGEKITEWFVTSLEDHTRFKPRTLAKLYHRRWRVETSFQEFKVFFHADVLRSKTVDNIEKEFAAHVLAYQLMRRLIVEAAKKHHKKPTEISVLQAARWVLSFSSRMSAAPTCKLPAMYERLLDAIASTQIDIRHGRLEPRALARDRKHYPYLRISRTQWRIQRLAGVT